MAKEDQKIALHKTTIQSNRYFDVNRIAAAIGNDGIFARHPITGNCDFRFDGHDVIYTSGLWLATKVNSEIRASAADYLTDWIGGAIDGQGNPFGKEDSTFRVYKISRGDNASNNPDYAEWPIQQGAPSDGQGHPLLIGDQTLWCSFTDAYLENREYTKCPPLGAEVHLTVWGWQEIDNVVFLRWKIHNKSNQIWKDTFIGIFSDPDMINASDDLVGTDSTLSLAYCYDSEDYGANFVNLSAGYVALETPIQFSPGDTAFTFYGPQINYRNIPPWSPRMDKSTSDGWNDIPYDQNAHLNVYRRLQCINTKGEPMIDPITGMPSHWAYSGDPITGAGWVDRIGRDRRMLISSGPLNLTPGDTTAFTMAIVAVQRHKRLDNVIDIKQNARAVLSTFRKSAALYTETQYAAPGQQGFFMPLKLLNTAEVKALRFTLTYSPDHFTLRDVSSSNRASGFSTHFSTAMPGSTVVELTSIGNQTIPPGNGVIATLKLDLNGNMTEGALPFQIINAEFMNKDDQMLPLDSSTGAIRLEVLPQPPQLQTPTNGQYLDGMKINFSWSKTTEADSVHYLLQFTNNERFYQENVLDTGITLPMSKFVFYRDSINEFGWFVSLMNYSQPIISDTFVFQLPSEQKLTFARPLYRCDLSSPSTNESIIGVFYQLPYAYVIKNIWSQWTAPDSQKLVVVRLEESNGQIINLQDFPFYSDGLLQVRGDKAFSFFPSTFRSYSVSDSQKFILQRTFNLGFSIVSFLIHNDYLFFLTEQYNRPTKLVVYQIISLVDLKKVTELSLNDWLPTGVYYTASDEPMRIKDHYLYLAYGDWGIFDIVQPESLKLIARVDVPDLATVIDYENGKVYVGNNKDWLGIFDVTTPDHPQLIYAENFKITSWRSRQTSSWEFDRLTVYDNFIYLDCSGDLQVCHYEPGKYFELDGIFEAFHTYVTTDRIYAINPQISQVNNISVYKNNIATHVATRGTPMVDDFHLFQNYPNPFNHATQIRYDLNENGKVKITIYNIQGQFIKCLIDQYHQAGSYKLTWDGTDFSDQPVASGLFFYQLKTEHQTLTKKMLLLK